MSTIRAAKLPKTPTQTTPIRVTPRLAVGRARPLALLRYQTMPKRNVRKMIAGIADSPFQYAASGNAAIAARPSNVAGRNPLFCIAPKYSKPAATRTTSMRSSTGTGPALNNRAATIAIPIPTAAAIGTLRDFDATAAVSPSFGVCARSARSADGGGGGAALDGPTRSGGSRIADNGSTSPRDARADRPRRAPRRRGCGSSWTSSKLRYASSEMRSSVSSAPRRSTTTSSGSDAARSASRSP